MSPSKGFSVSSGWWCLKWSPPSPWVLQRCNVSSSRLRELSTKSKEKHIFGQETEPQSGPLMVDGNAHILTWIKLWERFAAFIKNVWDMTGSSVVAHRHQGCPGDNPRKEEGSFVWWQCLFLGPPRPLHPHCTAFLLSGWKHTDLWHPQSSFLSLLCSKSREGSIWLSLNETWITFQPRMGKGPDQPCGAATLGSEENGGRHKSYWTI